MRTIGTACGLGAAILLLTGCGSPNRQQQFDHHLRQATVELNQGRIEQAEGSIAAASRHASGTAERRKVEDLQHLRSGTAQYLAGDLAAAIADWRRIEDPSLRRQLLVAAGDAPEGGRR